LDEIDYGILIEGLIQDFPPVKRLWPLNIRLFLWILLEAAILTLVVLLNGALDSVDVVSFHSHGLVTTGFILVSIAAAGMALRNSIPGRESGAVELIVLTLMVIGAALMVQFEPSNLALLPSVDLLSTLGRQLTLSALPWLALFWAARRAMPLRPRLIGGLIGVAASGFGIAAGLISNTVDPIAWELSAGAVITLLSVVAGAEWLNSERLLRIDSSRLSTDRPCESAWLEARVILPVAAALVAGLLLFVLKSGTSLEEPVPDFDLAIENYQQALANFRPNVPSTSLETLLTSYIEHGMPPYMCNFGPLGFKLQGGRFEHLADGTPVTYTWFRGPTAGVMCMLRQVSGFAAPGANHSETHHLFFYRYRGYSVCLINVGGYGDFVSVIASPIPMKQFMRAVFGALSIEAR
jgi:hypothetical protein